VGDIVPALPPLIEYDQYGGNWQRYIDEVFSVFYRDLIASRAQFKSAPVSIDTRMGKDGKEEGFWHLTHSGPKHARIPDLGRCARVPWLRPLIETVPGSGARWWRGERDGKLRDLVADPPFSYLIVLQVSRSRAVLITAIYIEYQHRRRKLEREWRDYHQNAFGAPP
jgi:hypothetical protein